MRQGSVFYISEPGFLLKNKIVWPMNPSDVRVVYGTQEASLDMINNGQVVIPRGAAPTRMTWSGLLPGPNTIKNLRMAQKGAKPVGEMLALIDSWRAKGPSHPAVILDIVIIDSYNTPVAMKGTVSNFEHGATSWWGDLAYTIEWVEAKPLEVKVFGGDTSTGQANTRPRVAPQPLPSYTVRPGDTLMLIARRQLGASSKWQSLYLANRTVITDVRTLTVGQKLVLPRA